MLILEDMIVGEDPVRGAKVAPARIRRAEKTQCNAFALSLRPSPVLASCYFSCLVNGRTIMKPSLRVTIPPSDLSRMPQEDHIVPAEDSPYPPILNLPIKSSDNGTPTADQVSPSAHQGLDASLVDTMQEIAVKLKGLELSAPWLEEISNKLGLLSAVLLKRLLLIGDKPPSPENLLTRLAQHAGAAAQSGSDRLEPWLEEISNTPQGYSRRCGSRAATIDQIKIGGSRHRACAIRQAGPGCRLELVSD